VALVARRQETKRLDNYTWSFLQKNAVHTFGTPVDLKAPNEMKRERERERESHIINLQMKKLRHLYGLGS
jgi:short-subunit dehydrogenase